MLIRSKGGPAARGYNPKKCVCVCVCVRVRVRICVCVCELCVSCV